jgi:tetratricopeptide (TPR) repeat protein
VLNDLGDFPRAIQAYEKAARLRPRDRAALVGLIDALMASDQADEAESWVTKALQEYPDDPVVLGYGARAAYDAHRLDTAISLADRALARDPHNLHALLAIARTHLARGQWDRALPSAERAVAAAPNDLGALQLLQKIETRLGLKERAAQTQSRREAAQERIATMNRLGAELASHPEDPRIPWQMGQTAQDSGSYLLASRCFQAALALDASFQPARQSLAALQAAHPELTQASGRSLSLPSLADGSSPPSATSP